MYGDLNSVAVAVYCRVSTDGQARGYSLAAQERRVRAYVEARGWEVAGVYTDCKSGKDLRRPGYRRMMKDSGEWDAVAVWRIDRIHRDAKHFASMMAAFKDAGKEFVAVCEELDSTTVYGAFAMDIIARIAQLESEQLGERVLLGMAQKARRGEFMGRVPFGYRKGEDGLLVAPGEASAVQYAFTLRAGGVSYDRIAYLLNLSADPPAWNGPRVRRMISNPVYVGFVRWNGIIAEGSHRPIITQDLWEKANGGRPVPSGGLRPDMRMIEHGVYWNTPYIRMCRILE